ncbi:MAG TPA: hypothetical protein VM030_07510 [Acidimicrobiales bacterium]|nr:hypothetical protein [Acidimicrobiales bacterium]
MQRHPRSVLALIASMALAAVLAVATLPAAAERSAGTRSRHHHAKRAHFKAKPRPGAKRPEPKREEKRPEPKREEKRPQETRLACARTDSTSTVTCRWAPSDDPAFASYRLQRAAVERTPSGEKRHGEPVTVFESPDRSTSSFVDGTATGDHGWMYRLTVRDANGAVIAASEPVGVRPSDPPPEAEHAALRLACIAGRPEGQPGVTCRWDRSDAPGFAAYRVMRKSADAEPAVLASITDRDRTFHLDRTVEDGHSYAYAVQVMDGDGRVIARSEPVRVTCCPSGENAPAA